MTLLLFFSPHLAVDVLDGYVGLGDFVIVVERQILGSGVLIVPGFQFLETLFHFQILFRSLKRRKRNHSLFQVLQPLCGAFPDTFCGGEFSLHILRLGFCRLDHVLAALAFAPGIDGGKLLLFEVLLPLLGCFQLGGQFLLVPGIFGNGFLHLVDAGGQEYQILVELPPLLGGNALPLVDGVAFPARPRHGQVLHQPRQLLVGGKDILIGELPCQLEEDLPLLVGFHGLCKVAGDKEHFELFERQPGGPLYGGVIVFLLGLYIVNVIVGVVPGKFLRCRTFLIVHSSPPHPACCSLLK